MRIQQIIDLASEYCDVDYDMGRAIDYVCSKSGISKETAAAAKFEAMKQDALAAGIPLSVIEGKTKLRDHFSQEYIDMQCNRPPKGEGETA